MIKPVSSWADYSMGRSGSILVLCDNGQFYQLMMHMENGQSSVKGATWQTVGPPIPGTEADLAQQQEE
jgi:hypothetical protein